MSARRRGFHQQSPTFPYIAANDIYPCILTRLTVLSRTVVGEESPLHQQRAGRLITSGYISRAGGYFGLSSETVIVDSGGQQKRGR